MNPQAQAVRQAAHKPSATQLVLQYRTAEDPRWCAPARHETPADLRTVAIAWRVLHEATYKVSETVLRDGCLVPAGTYIFRQLLDGHGALTRVPHEIAGAPVLTTVALEPEEMEVYIPATAQG